MARIRLAIALIAVTGGTAAAQVVYTPGIDPDRFVLSSDPHSIGELDSARVLGQYDYSFGSVLRLGAPPLQVCAQEQGTNKCAQQGDIVSSRFGTDLVGALGLGRVTVYAQLPVVLHQGSDFDVKKGAELTVAGIGDLRLGGKLRLFDRSASTIALDERAVVPTGTGDFTSDNGVSLESRLIAGHQIDRLGLMAQVGYSWRQKPSRLANLYVDDEVLAGAGVDYAFTPSVTAGVSVFGRFGIMTDPNPPMGMSGKPGWEERPIETMGAVRYLATAHVVVEAAAGAGLDHGYGAPAFRALAGVRYVFEDNDWDRDGIPNTVDRCPRVPEDKDGFEDEDGCPDPDNDKDGIPDVADKCPNDPEDKDGFQDEDGCPDPDNDKDGIPDVADKCPNEPEDKDGFEDDDGCPELDNDKDGIADKDDKCPNDPEDKDGFQDEDGCPENDNDNDKILDKDDKCPNEPETVNGFQDEDGCPDTPPKVIVTATQIVITETVYFDTDKSTIKPVSFPLLDEVAQVIVANPQITKISVDGHTDDVGDDNYNMKLSQRRAESVRKYLVKKGVDDKRLVAHGYGESRPKVKGTTKDARDANRRVEFLILEQTAKVPVPGTAPTPTLAPGPPPTP